MSGPDSSLDEPGALFAEASSRARFAALTRQLPREAARLLPQFLAESANPDQSVLQLEVLLQRHSTEALQAFASSALALQACVVLFGSSQWLGQSLLLNPDLLVLFSRPAGLASPRLADDLREQFARFRLRHHELPLPVLLARFKRREYVRIYVRELLALGSLAEVTGEISALTDVLLEQALAECESDLRRRFQGWPDVRGTDGRLDRARFTVLALGKLGGNELNYSSDIDLLFLCDDRGDAGTVTIPAREFFTRLAQELTAILSNVSAEGQVFRVDLRLRPLGASGEVVVGFGQAMRYYQEKAHDWELQALLKLRHSAGDAALAREFEEQVQKLIYRDALSLTAIETAARSLDRIQRGVTRQPPGTLDVKNGSGGLREIEFVTQCLQRVHGGREPWLRSSGTLAALQKLHDKEHIADVEFRELCETYTLLRAIEHRLQCRQGGATHRLPQLAAEQRALFRSLGARRVRDVRELRDRMSSSADLCSRVLRLGGGESPLTAQVARLGQSGAERLSAALSAHSAELARVLALPMADATRRNLQRFLAAAATDEERIASTVANADLVERALPVFTHSALATDLLSRYPADIGALFLPDRESAPLAADDLRVAARRGALRNIGATILERQPLQQALYDYSLAFDDILRRALLAVAAPAGFAVFALGRLGPFEIDVLSDADLLFLHGPQCDADSAGACARAFVALLSGYTREGSVIAVDARLRPHGEQGELVASMRQFAQYCESEAVAWEALALGKLRFVGGDASFAAEAVEAVLALRRRFAAAPDFAAQLRTTRKKMEDSAGAANFKAGTGGLYDIDYLTGTLEARRGLLAASVPLQDRIQRLADVGALTAEQCEFARRAALLCRSLDHAIRIVEGRSRRWLPPDETLRLVESVSGVPTLDATLRATIPAIRALFDAYFQD